MKKTLLFLGLASVMSAFTGCVKENLNDGVASEEKGGAPATLIASVGGENETRTEIVDGKMVWKNSDRIKVFSEDAQTTAYGVTYKLKAGFDGQKKGEFELLTTPSPAISQVPYYIGTEMCYVAVYPAQQLSTQLPDPSIYRLSTEIGAEIPDYQQYVAGSYDPMAVPMMAVFETETDPLKFKFMGGMVRTSITSANSDQIEKIVLRTLGDTGGAQPVIDALAGTMRAQFYPDGMMASYIPDAEVRAKIFTDMSSPMIYNESTRYVFNFKGVDAVAIVDDNNGAIDLSPSPTQFTFGVLPGSHSLGLTVKVVMMDGSAIEKKTAGGKINPGQMINLPTFELPTFPIMPDVYVEDASVDGYEMEDGNVESYDLQVAIMGELLLTVPMTMEGGMASISKEDLNAKLAELVGRKITPGSTDEYELILRANFKSGQPVTAVYSAPAYYEYTAGMPDMKIVINPNFETEGSPYTMQIDNAYMYTGLTIEWAAAEGTQATADFTGATFTKYDPNGWGATIPLAGFEKTYTIAVRLMDGTTQVGVFYKSVTTPKAPVAPALDVTLAYGEVTDMWGDKSTVFTPTGLKEILKYYPDATWEIHYKKDPTSATDMEGATVLDMAKDTYAAEKFSWYNDILNWPEDNSFDGTYNVRVVVKSNGTAFEYEGETKTTVESNIVESTYVFVSPW